MGNPLQDQLLKAGLVSKKQAGKIKHEQYQKRKKTSGKSGTDQVRSEQTVQAERKQRNQELNQQRQEKQRRHEQQAQIKQLIDKNRMEQDEKNGSPYHFAVQKQIRRIFVAEEMADQLSRGRLAIVRFQDSFEVVPAKIARQIAKRDQEAVVILHEE